MKRDVELVEFTCDGCGKKRLSFDDGGMAEGFHGDVTQVTGAGGTGGEFYACSPKCIRNAVLRGIEISLMNPDEFAEAAGWR